MKSLMIAAPNSNSGKTIISSAILYALQKRGLNISGFKTGPDQVDRKILEKASGKPAGNVDFFLMGEQGARTALGLPNSDYALIEGVMGCFDGIGLTYDNSSFDVAQKLDINIVLVYAPIGEMFTIIPKLKGMQEFSNGRICGIVLNKISPAMYPFYKKMIEENLTLKVLGFFPTDEKLKIDETALGLSLDENFTNSSFLDLLESTVSANIDIDTLLSTFRETNTIQQKHSERKPIKIAVALDDAFNLYYTENLYLLSTLGTIEYFSPLKDEKIPNCDFIYFGSGNLKNFVSILSENKKMLASIKEFSENNGYILAEGEAVSYLFEQFEKLPMCGIFTGYVETTKSLHNFGYKFIECNEDCVLGKKGTIIPTAEYHKSKAITNEKHIFTITKPNNTKGFADGYKHKNTLAMFQNTNFISYFENITDNIYKHQ